MGCARGVGWGPGKPLEETSWKNYKFTANAVSHCPFWSSSPNSFVWTRINGEPPTPAPSWGCSRWGGL